LFCKAEAEVTNKTIMLANRLVSGLASENVRWAEAVEGFRRQESTLTGDVLLSAAFVSYLGCFTKTFRVELVDKYWVPYLSRLSPQISFTKDLDPLSLLTDDAQVAQWNNDGLPSDRMSTENATILTNTQRWPLMIDPQLQGIKWIKVISFNYNNNNNKNILMIDPQLQGIKWIKVISFNNNNNNNILMIDPQLQ